MGLITTLRDGFANIMTGTGTSVDKRAYGGFVHAPMSPQQIEAAYRGSWLMRKAIKRPAKDMTREWRDWQAEKREITFLEAAERKLGLRDKIRRALILGRLGGGAIIIGAPQGNPLLPLNLKAIGEGGLRYLHVVSRWQLTLGPMITDPENDLCGQPEYFELHGSGAREKIHPSRVLAFRGEQVPEMGVGRFDDTFWGDSLVQVIHSAVLNAEAAQSNISSLIDEAKIDVVKVKDLMANAGSKEYETAFMRRIELAQAGKSVHRALILDSEEDWQQKQITWNGIPDVLRTYLAIVAGAADIPATILLGKSPDGMNATGDADFRAYYDQIRSDQDNDLRPLIERLDEVLIRSTFGRPLADVGFTFAPLWQLDEKEAGEVENKFADTVTKLVNSGTVPVDALSKAVQNRMVESGQWPGLDGALDESDGELPGQEEDEADPSDLQAANENNVVQLRRRGSITADQATALLTDAKPRTLYVQRKLLNGAEFIRWAKGEGFETTTPADELHVTICFSRTPVDWMKMGSEWSSSEDGKLTVPAGGARLVEKLGDKGAVVLLFASSSLAWRHEDMKRNGASFDFDEYQPHVTITYQAPADLDLSKVEPFRGKLVFGPEIFSEVEEDWEKSLVEDGGGPNADLPFADAKRRRGGGAGSRPGFNQAQPRGRDGRWVETGAGKTNIRSHVAKALKDKTFKQDHEFGRVTGNAPPHVIGSRRVANAQEIRKNHGRHGDPVTEAARGQAPVTARDYGRIPEITAKGTYREIGTKGARKPVRVEYRVRIGKHEYVYTETVGAARQRVALISLYKKL